MRFKFLIILIFLTPIAEAKRANPRIRYLKSKYTTKSYGLRFWQETFKVTTNGQSDQLVTRAESINYGWYKSKPLKSLRWVRDYGIDINLGTFRGSTLSDSDKVKNQIFLMASGFYGYTYRTTLRSSIGFSLPLAFKYVSWDVENSLDIDDQMYSIGLSGAYNHRLSLRSKITLSLAHQFMWDTSIWTLSYSKEFR